MIITFFIGLVLSYSTIHFQSIIIPAIIHGAMNSLAAFGIYFGYIIMGKDLKKFDDTFTSKIIDDLLDPSNQTSWHGLVEKFEFQKMCLHPPNTD